VELAAQNDLAFVVRQQFVNLRNTKQTLHIYEQRLGQMQSLLEKVNELVSKNITSRQQLAQLQNRIAHAPLGSSIA